MNLTQLFSERNKRAVHTFAALLIPALLIIARSSSTQAADIYQVEMVVFANDAAYASREVWPANIDLTLPQPLSVLRNSDGVAEGAAADLNAYEKLPATSLTLRNEAAALARSRHRILLHTAWLQRIGGASSATNVYVDGGESFAPYHEFAGTLRFYRQQFVHVDTNLWLAKFSRATHTTHSAAVQAAASVQASAATPAVSWPLPPLPPQHPDAAGYDNGAADSAALNEMLLKDYSVERIVLLQQHRRLKQHELNYLDHPLMGVLIKVMPYDASPAAAAAPDSAAAQP